MSNMRVKAPNCFSAELNSSCRRYEQQQQQQRFGDGLSWLNRKTHQRGCYNITPSKILLLIGLSYRGLKSCDYRANLKLEQDHRPNGLHGHLKWNLSSLRHGWLFSLRTTASSSNSRIQRLISTENYWGSLTPNTEIRHSDTVTINVTTSNIVSKNQKSDPVQEVNCSDPRINSNNNSSGSRNRRKRSRQTVLHSGFKSEQSRNTNREESDDQDNVIPRLDLGRILEQESQPSSSTWDAPSDSIMGSGPSGPKKKPRVQTNIVNGVLVSELDTDAQLNKPSMPVKNEQININNSKSDPVSVAPEKVLGRGSNTTMNGSDFAGTKLPKTPNMPKKNQKQTVHHSLDEEDEPCESPSLCTCRPYSAGGKMLRTRPPSYEIYAYLESIFRVEGREVDYVQGDGNCFFRALSKQIYSSEECHFELRQTILELMERHRSEFEQFTDTQDFATHIQEMRRFAVWATTAEIYGAATLLQRDIYVFSPDHTGTQYRWLLFSPRFPYDRNVTSPCQQCYITLCHTNGNHYDRVISLDASCNCTLTVPELAGGSITIDLVCDTNTNNTDEPMGKEEVQTDHTLQPEE